MNRLNCAQLSDEKLLQLCQQYGAQARTWRQKFAGLLPEVNKRQLYAKKGFHSIFEFAAKLAGMSEEQVKLVLNLERRFEDKPVLKSMLESGDVSMNKLAKIVSIATPENQEILANQAQILSTRALETLVRGERIFQKENVEFENQNGSQKLLFEGQPLHVNSKVQDVSLDVKSVSNEASPANPLELLQLKLTRGNLQKMLELQEKGIDLNNLIAEMLGRREAEIAQQKKQIAEEMGGKTDMKQDRESSKPSRYIPVKIKRIITLEHGTKCSIPTCTKSSRPIHHTQRFGLMQHAAPQLAHNPYYLAPLCKEHHTIAHSIDVKFHEKRGKRAVEQY